MYIHEQTDWPHFFWDQTQVTEALIPLRHRQGKLIGRMESMGFRQREDTVVHTLARDVVKSSEIEGEILDESLVRSSVAHHLGIEVGAVRPVDRNIDGVVEMVLDARQRFDQSLTKNRLLGWHALLFPYGTSGLKKIRVGSWRIGPVQVVSGGIGKEIVHFEGPAAARIEREMHLFLEWLNHESAMDLVLKAAVAHLWFVTIHPFDDGNGRIGRAIIDYLLARSEGSSYRVYSLSAQIQLERKRYYTILEQSQKGLLDITPWIIWFIGCLDRAIGGADSALDAVVRKARFWESQAEVNFNDRQRKMINRLLEGLEGKLTSSKWAKIAKCSQDTAYRDIVDLLERGIIIKNPEGGRSTSYFLADFK